jgi:hypothetical protein
MLTFRTTAVPAKVGRAPAPLADRIGDIMVAVCVVLPFVAVGGRLVVSYGANFPRSLWVVPTKQGDEKGREQTFQYRLHHSTTPTLLAQRITQRREPHDRGLHVRVQLRTELGRSCMDDQAAACSAHASKSGRCGSHLSVCYLWVRSRSSG